MNHIINLLVILLTYKFGAIFVIFAEIRKFMPTCFSSHCNILTKLTGGSFLMR